MAHPYGAPTAAAPRRPARRRRWPWVLLSVVVVLAALFVAADRIALAVAENKAATTLQTSQNLRRKPSVSVAGFPFLTQLAAGRFGAVTIRAAGIDVGDQRTLRIASVTVHLHEVTVPRNYSSVRAQTATADALIDYADLSQTLRTPVSYAGDGKVQARPSVTVLGQTFRGTVEGRVNASSAAGITFSEVTVGALGVPLPAAASQALAKVFDNAVSLAGLPFGVRVTGLDATPAGLVLHLSGQNLEYRRG